MKNKMEITINTKEQNKINTIDQGNLIDNFSYTRQTHGAFTVLVITSRLGSDDAHPYVFVCTAFGI